MSNIGGSGGRSLIYVHGRDFKPAADTLFDLVIAAINAGMDRDNHDRVDELRLISKTIAYYGDIGNEFLEKRGRAYDEQLDVGDRRNALNLLCDLARRKDFGVSCYDRLPGKTAIAEFVADVAAPLLGSIGLGGVLISKVAPDVAEFWNKKDNNYRDAVLGRVREAIRAGLDRNDHIILISHGSGCIAAYDALWQLSHDEKWAGEYAEKKIDSWVTLGSPLGDTTVRKRLLGASSKNRERFPCNVVTWHNISAEDDYLCHDNTCADDFKPMLKQRQISSIRDYRIYNLTVRYGKSNPHSSLGYLNHPRTSSIIAEWLCKTATGPTHQSIL